MVVKKLQDMANIIRRDSLAMTTEAESGHPTSALSIAELTSVLFFNEMKFDVNNPFNPDNDEFILSKGHADAALYSAICRAKLTPHSFMTLRKLKSPFEGHPIPSAHLPWIKVGTGSLGQGLSVGVGMALAAKLQKRKCKTYVLIGDSESAEGSVWEAIELASHYKLNNLIGIIDVNRLGQRGETMVGWKIDNYKKKFQAFGWNAITIDGHNINRILSAFKKANKSKKPTMIIAKTVKGKGVSFLENKNGWHGKPVPKQDLKNAMDEIPCPKMPKFSIKKPKKTNFRFTKKPVKSNNYKIGDEVATRDAYGNALAKIAKSDSSVIAVDGEVSNSTKSEKVKEATPKQFVESFIAEQNMVGTALGLSKKNYNAFASSFSAFLSRAHDQIRMAAISKPSSLTFCGSHSGVSIGKDGASQMGLEDIAMFRSTPYCHIFYPSDAVSTEKLTHLAYKTAGMKYIRTNRPKTPVIYNNNEKFPLGEFKILKQSKKDKVVIIGAGVTLHEALKAHQKLQENKMQTAVIDLYCIRPLKIQKLINFIKKHGNKVVISEDHYPEGGIGEMLASGLIGTGIKMAHLAVSNIPHSGTGQELLDKYGISSKHIVKAVKELK